MDALQQLGDEAQRAALDQLASLRGLILGAPLHRHLAALGGTDKTCEGSQKVSDVTCTSQIGTYD